MRDEVDKETSRQVGAAEALAELVVGGKVEQAYLTKGTYLRLMAELERRATMEPKPLTCRQQQLLEFIQKFLEENHYAPNFQEMAKGVGLRSKNSISVLLNGLEEAGYITRRRAEARTVALVEKSSQKSVDSSQKSVVRSQ